jgi:hypothetical protein
MAYCQLLLENPIEHSGLCPSSVSAFLLPCGTATLTVLALIAAISSSFGMSILLDLPLIGKHLRSSSPDQKRFFSRLIESEDEGALFQLAQACEHQESQH